MTPWTAARQASLYFTNSQRLFKLMSIESMMPSSHLILCLPLLLPPSIFPSVRVFSSESALPIRCPRYWSFSFSISPSNEYSGLISFRMDWLDLLTVQRTLKSLPRAFSPHQNRHQLPPPLQVEAPKRKLTCSWQLPRNQQTGVWDPLQDDAGHLQGLP